MLFAVNYLGVCRSANPFS